MLLIRFTKNKTEAKFMRMYQAEIAKNELDYRIPTGSPNKMMKDIHQSLKKIE